MRSDIGRIGCFAFGRPYVVPVTYAYDGVAVYAHSREGLKLRMMRNNPNVHFEVDSVEGCSTWKSVIALGTFSELEAREAEFAMEILRRRFAPLVPSATSVPTGTCILRHAVVGLSHCLGAHGRFEAPDA